MTLVSFCSTHFNTYPVTGRSLESVLRLTEGIDREIVIFDNFSNDGSYDVLSSYLSSVPMRLVRRRCTRGIGRQLAFEMSRGEFVVTFDLDVIYNSKWAELVRWVIANGFPFMLDATYSHMIPRYVLEQVGGWRDLSTWEDFDLCLRAADKGLYRTYPILCGENLKRRYTRDPVSRWIRFYRNYRDHVTVLRWIPLGLYIRGYAALLRRDFWVPYYLSVFLPAFLAGLRKRKLLRTEHRDATAPMSPATRIDCGLVPSEELDYDFPYGTTELCRQALARRNFGWLCGFYE